jgi:hypothetical protein
MPRSFWQAHSDYVTAKKALLDAAGALKDWLSEENEYLVRSGHGIESIAGNSGRVEELTGYVHILEEQFSEAHPWGVE